MSRKKPRNLRRRAKTAKDAFPIVCVGASAGGLEAFTRLLETLPPDIGMAFVIIQHLDPNHPSALSPLLAKKSALPVMEALEGTRVKPNQVYVIPPDTVMTISRRVLRLATRASERKYMPIDHFMRSLAEDAGNLAIGIILSGTASDGTLGLESIKAAGGLTFAQDENSARYSGMPSSAKASGFVDFVLPPEGIARELARINGHPAFAPPASLNLENVGVAGSNDQFSAIFELLRKYTGLVFGAYKRTTVRRRIARRMTLQKLGSLDQYINLLQKSRLEVEALSQDLLIRVTTFFRDAEAFDALKKKVLPALLKQLDGRESIRVWVPGCSTGEEVYSIGMCLVEILEEAAPAIPCQIFATDISEAAIEKARSGIYADRMKNEVSPARLRRFFTKTAEGYRISKRIRDMCIFARQDLTKDPPFSKLDLISCRNVLIYMNSDLQKRIIPIFHYALRPGGYLMLGSAESAGSFSTLFSLGDKKGKIYIKKSSSGDLRIEYPGRTPKAQRVAPETRSSMAVENPSTELDLFREADRLMLTRYAPAGVLTTDELDVLQFRGNTTPFIEQAPGKPTINLLKLVKEELVFELRSAAEKARRHAVPVRTQAVEDRRNGHPREVVIDVVPIQSAQSKKPFLLVLFHETLLISRPGKSRLPSPRKSETRLAQQLRRELTAVRDELQSVVEAQEAAQEEFKSANEEILSSNEELQSTNEELETAKEELQSANEELTTLNEELLTRNNELGQLNSDITNLLSSINVPILMLSQELRIRRFTPVAGMLLNLIPGDVGRPITDINPNIDLPNFDRLVAGVIDSMIAREQEVRARDGRWYSLRIRPYRTLDNKIDGATVIFLDIDALKKSRQAEALFNTIREPLLLLTSKLRVLSANRPFLRLLDVDEQ